MYARTRAAGGSISGVYFFFNLFFVVFNGGGVLGRYFGGEMAFPALRWSLAMLSVC